ncbi:MAG: hypothetical protein ACRECN_02955 [Methylocella sp.]
MTLTDIRALESGVEIRRLICEMMRLDAYEADGSLWIADPQYPGISETFSPDDDHNDAMKVTAWWVSKNAGNCLNIHYEKGHISVLVDRPDHEYQSATGPTLALAICRAVLLAAGQAAVRDIERRNS